MAWWAPPEHLGCALLALSLARLFTRTTPGSIGTWPPRKTSDQVADARFLRQNSRFRAWNLTGLVSVGAAIASGDTQLGGNCANSFLVRTIGGSRSRILSVGISGKTHIA